MFFFFVCTSSHCVSVNSQVVPTLLDGSLAEMQHSSTAPSTSNVGAAAAATGVANRSFINKPARGWLHSDVVIVREGITYLVRVSWPTSPSPSPPPGTFLCVCVCGLVPLARPLIVVSHLAFGLTSLPCQPHIRRSCSTVVSVFHLAFEILYKWLSQTFGVAPVSCCQAAGPFFFGGGGGVTEPER